MNNAEKILYKELSYEINGILFEVHNSLGRFCNHKQYCDVLEVSLKKNNINYDRELEAPIKFKDTEISGNIVDFIIDNKIVLDVKAKKAITKKDYIQMQRYLKAANIKLGLIVNFAEKSIKPLRVINNSHHN